MADEHGATLTVPIVCFDFGDRQQDVPAGDSVIGRSRRSDLVISDRSMSRSHALVSVIAGRITLQDLNSANGTFINGVRLKGESPLLDGDVVTLGETEVTVRISLAGGDETRPPQRPASPATAPPPPEPSLRGPSRSEALAVGDVLPIGEVLAEETSSWESTGPIPGGGSAEHPELVEAATMEPPPEMAVPPLAPPAEIAAEVPPAATPPAAAAPSAAAPSAAGSAAGRPWPAGAPTLEVPALKPPEVPAAPPPPAAAPPAPPPRPRATGPTLVVPAASRPGPVTPAASRPGRAATPPPAPPGQLLPSIDDLDSRLGLAPLPPLPPPRPAVGGRLPAAGFGIRAGAALLDGGMIAAVSAIVSFVAGGPFDATGGALGIAVATILAILVPLVGWSRWGTTPGKRLLGLYVCDLSGQVGLPPGRSVVRWLGYGVSGALLGAGFWMVLFSASRRGLHDLMAGSYVGRRG
jgi:uncharacterized RDD family membrane protein YckC